MTTIITKNVQDIDCHCCDKKADIITVYDNSNFEIEFCNQCYFGVTTWNQNLSFPLKTVENNDNKCDECDKLSSYIITDSNDTTLSLCEYHFSHGCPVITLVQECDNE